jgi:putative methyltransferase (TIGR04325 family)
MRDLPLSKRPNRAILAANRPESGEYQLALSLDNGNLNIIDFGGGLSTNYFQYRRILLHCNMLSIRWNIVEHNEIVKLGVLHFENEQVKFFNNLDAALQLSPKSQSVLFTGSLQLIDQPFEVLDKIIANGTKIIAFDRLLVGPQDKHRVFLRHPDPNYFPSSFSEWCFSRDLFVGYLENGGYKLVEDFTDNPNRHFDVTGMIFVKLGVGRLVS